MEFNNPWVLVGIVAIALPWLVLQFWRERARTAALPYPALPGRKLPASIKSRLRWLPDVLRFFVFVLLFGALAGPRVPTDEIPMYKEGIDIVVAMDISTSMKALDFEPSDRFSVAKQTIADFIKGRKNDRLGLVVFAGEAYTQCPLTLDYAVLLNVLDTVRMDVIEDGTAIGDALATAVNRLRESQAKSKVVVLLTDGANNRGQIDPEKAAQLASEFGIRIHTIQIGTGGTVPYPTQTRDFFTGRVVQTVQRAQIPVNPELLRSIADTTKGRFFEAANSESLKRVFEDIDSMERTELPGEQFVMYDEIYSSFAFPALLLLMLEWLVRLFWIRKFP